MPEPRADDTAAVDTAAEAVEGADHARAADSGADDVRADDSRADDEGAAPRRVRTRRRTRQSWARRKHLGLWTTTAALVVLVVGVLLVVLTWNDGRASFSQQVAAAAPSGTGSSGTAPSGTASPGTSAPVTSAAPTTASSSPPASSAAGPTTVRGTIAAVGDRSWTVTATSGLTYTVVVTDDTTLPRKRDFDSFAVGDAISVKGTLDQGTVTATSVVPGKSS